MEAQNTHNYMACSSTKKKFTALSLRTNSKTYPKTITHSLSFVLFLFLLKYGFQPRDDIDE